MKRLMLATVLMVVLGFTVGPVSGVNSACLKADAPQVNAAGLVLCCCRTAGGGQCCNYVAFCGSFVPGCLCSF